MTQNEDTRALVRVIALAVAGDEEEAEKIVAWAYRDDEPVQRAQRPVNAERVRTNFDIVLDMWNSSMKVNVPKIRELTAGRRLKVRLRIDEMGGWDKAEPTLAECFRKINESDFCNGSSGKWTATFDWFFSNDKNWRKVLEGNYDNRKEKSSLENLSDNIAKADAYYGQRYGSAGPYGNPKGGWADGPDEQ